jgi:predicted AlkP superfamily phosphohydrolase/phosphomutase
VDAAELDRVTSELADWARGLPWVERVVPRQEAFDGRESARAPDLVLVPQRGFDPKGSLRTKETERRGVFTGMHTPDDAFFVHAGHAPPAEPIRVESVAATALGLLGLDVAELDGERL